MTILTLLLFLGACNRSSRTQDQIRIGISPWPAHEYFFLAQKKGFFQQQGITVKIIEYSDTSDTRRAFERNQIDVMAGSHFGVLLAKEYSQKQTQVFAVTDVSDGADVLIARSSVRKLGSLKGKILGAEVSSVSFYLLARALESYSDISLDDVIVIPMSQTRAEDALRKGEIEVAATYTPYSLSILSNPNYHVLFSSKDIPGEILHILAAEKNQIERRGDQFAKLMYAYFEAVRYARQHPDEAYAFMAARLHTSSPEFQKSLELVKLLPLEEQIHFLGPKATIRSIFQAAGQLLHRIGHLPQPYQESEAWTDHSLRLVIEMQKGQEKHGQN